MNAQEFSSFMLYGVEIPNEEMAAHSVGLAVNELFIRYAIEDGKIPNSRTLDNEIRWIKKGFDVGYNSRQGEFDSAQKAFDKIWYAMQGPRD